MTATLLLVDAYAMIYRAFYAIRQLTGPSGQPVNAIYGCAKMLRKYLAEHRPTHCAVVFDLGAPRQRLAILPSYKAQRPPTPPDLVAQLPAIRDLVRALRLPLIERDGEEADDIIAALARQATETGQSVLIASNDKDFAQLATDRVRLLHSGTPTDQVFDGAAVQAKYGVLPSQIVDLFSLIGDSVDNIPGVPGVGEKTAITLLQRFHDIDQLLARAAEIDRPKLREALLNHADRLRQNRQLIRLHQNLDLAVAWADLQVVAPDYPALLTALQHHGFRSLLAEIQHESRQGADLFAHI